MGVRTLPALALAASAFLSGCAQKAPPASAPEPAPARNGHDAVPEVRAQNGVANVDLDAVIDPVTKAPAFSYGGAVGVAPTIRLSPGDELRVNLHNKLPANTAAPNEVNLHFHGLEVSPDAPSDDAMRLAEPGQSVAYDIHLSPHQQPGLYWYHPHAHGQTFWQITSGMSGVIVVEGLQKHYPALATMRERILVLRNPQDPPDYGGLPIAARPEPERSEVIEARKRAGRFTNIDDDDAMGVPCGDTPGLRVTVNNSPHATIGIDPGERELFRVVNASAGRYFDLSDGHPLQLVALDGVALDAYPGSPAVETIQHLVIAPGARAEFVVTGAAKPLALRSRCFVSGQTGDRDPEVALADLRPDGAAPSGARSRAAIVPAAPAPHDALAAVAANHTFTFTEDVDGFYINGQKYAMGAPPAVVSRAGTLERWQLVNKTDEVHAFHIHQIHFAVEALDGKPEAHPHWVDTVTVPPQRYTHTRAIPGTATVLMDFRDPVIRGTFVFHCHILDHADGGMMSTIRVI